MYETEKLEEADYFLKQIVSAREDRKAHKHNLSAFLSAGRSVLQFANKEAAAKPGGQAWYDAYVIGNPVVKFFKDMRNENIHREPVSPMRENQVRIEDTLHFGDLENVVRIFSDDSEIVIIRDGKSVPRQQVSIVAEGTNGPYPSKVTLSAVYRFAEWKGTEDLPTLCSMYLAELRKIVAEGQSKSYLTP
jgi:hypothetical protein